MDLKDENITVSQKSKDLKSIKEDTKDSTKKMLNRFLASYPSNDSPTQLEISKAFIWFRKMNLVKSYIANVGILNKVALFKIFEESLKHGTQSIVV